MPNRRRKKIFTYKLLIIYKNNAWRIYIFLIVRKNSGFEDLDSLIKVKNEKNQLGIKQKFNIIKKNLLPRN